MGYVTSIFARRVVQGAGRSVDGPGLLRSLGLDPDASLDVTQMVAEDAYYDFLERLAGQMVSAHELPVRVGPLMRPDDYGALGLAWKSAPTIRQSLERVERFCRLWTDNMTYELRDDEEGALFVLHRAGERRLGLRLSNECTAASAVSLIRQTSTERFRPRRVLFKHRAPEITTAHQRYFGCPVEFGAALDAVSISDEALDRANHLGDDAISRFLMPHLEAEVEAIAQEDPLELLVQRAVSRALSEGVPKMAEIARRMGTSERTLQRRLADEGLSFKNLVDETRRRLAESLMQQPRYSLSEVGFLTGFSEQSAFSRAFKRWTGRSPAAYREARG
ncbi:AraC family transcriptional regulator [Acidobacteria bacterium Mor1]|nr:AraC family transcriptional regulator [Acidobacteria bacterium Mor1]